MELWIRSQDKMVLTRNVGLRIIIEQEGSLIIDETNDYILGVYNTEERALEVLDAIENILSYNQRKTTKYSYTNSGRLEESSLFEYIVYRMPEE